MTNHPITPPPELVQAWDRGWREQQNAPVIGWSANLLAYVATRAAQWGADRELEACLGEVSFLNGRALADRVRSVRRPKAPSLKEQALVALHAVATGANDMREQRQDFETIRLALEQLDD
jgi:hypothetical protein